MQLHLLKLIQAGGYTLDHILLLGKLRNTTQQVRKSDKRKKVDVRMLNQTNIKEEMGQELRTRTV